MNGSDHAFPQLGVETDLQMDGHGQKFPHVYSYDVGANGLTKRELFAALAVQGLCSGTPWPSATDGPEMAYRAVKFADALIEALNK